MIFLRLHYYFMLFLFVHCLVPYYLIIYLKEFTIIDFNLSVLFLYSLFGYANMICLSFNCHETRIFEIILNNVWKY